MNNSSARCAQLLTLNAVNTIASKFRRIDAFRSMIREFLPYAAIPRDDGQHILLNRNYKPLGLPSNGRHYDYNSPDFLMCSMVIDAAELERLHGVATRDGKGMVRYFYDDTAPPWRTPAALKAYRETLFRALRLREAA